MQIDIFIPPAVDQDMDNVIGWLVRCKPANDCASLFGPRHEGWLFDDASDALAAAHRHQVGYEQHVVDDGVNSPELELGLAPCEASHAIIAVCRSHA